MNIIKSLMSQTQQSNFNLNTWQAETEGLTDRASLRLHSKTLYQKVNQQQTEKRRQHLLLPTKGEKINTATKNLIY